MAAAMTPSVTTTQRRRMEKSITLSIMSVLVLRLGLFQLGLQGEGVGDGIGLAGCKAAEDLDIVVILAAGAYLSGFKAFDLAHEQGRVALDCLQRAPRHDHL